ncbi:hypothetical protein [Anaerocolumna sp. MB42-C2]|uniref:hypothetical protein n=1 Tax=Anaerocolumna sp. MB42-C2 TaxID=3070997 RepID=UPI0027DF2798|nr:hypothetical protein [Anaerocolumna sp. MB42-C2]WMJ88662.1 hypothetical protein RBU59_03870 [Anaerocolumna sp. MB42-C2]
MVLKQEKNKIKSNKYIILPLYILYILFTEVILGFSVNDIWDRLIASTIKNNKRSTL